MPLRIKHIYEPASDEDGFRVLVDRLWPRGLKKDDAAIDRWLKEIAPSTELRRWYGHAPERWEEFQRRYREELNGKPEILAELRAIAAKGPLTLLFAARDQTRNHAVTLREILLDRRG